MKCSRYLLLVLGLFIFACVNQGDNDNVVEEGKSDKSDMPDTVRSIPGQYIVILTDNIGVPLIKANCLDSIRGVSSDDKQLRPVLLDSVRSFAARFNIPKSKIVHVYVDAVIGFTAQLSEQQVVDLRADTANVSSVVQDVVMIMSHPIMQSRAIMQSNPIMQSRAIMQSDYDFDTENGESCAVESIGGSTFGGKKRTIVWLVDTGVDECHPDLNIDTTYAVSFTPNEPSIFDYNGHGTHLAGIIGAKEREIGTDEFGKPAYAPIGVSAGAKITPVKFMNSLGEGSWSDLVLALNHVAKYGIPKDVVNLSVGAWDPRQCNRNTNGVEAAIMSLAKCGIYVVISAGNDPKPRPAEGFFPGCINHANIFTVGSINCDQSCAEYSNFGDPPVDYVAVGTDVLSLWPTVWNCKTCKDGNEPVTVYRALTGTSMATAVVSGIVHAIGGAPNSNNTVECPPPSGNPPEYPIAHK